MAIVPKITTYCQDWHPNGGGPRTVVTVKDGVRSVRVYPSKDERLATLEAALRTIRSSIPGYLKGEMTEKEFALLVLEQADSSMVNKALEVLDADGN